MLNALHCQAKERNINNKLEVELEIKINKEIRDYQESIIM